MLSMISVLNLLRFVCGLIWSILENILCVLEKNVYSVDFEQNVLQVSAKSVWYSILFKAGVSLLIFCLNDLFIDESWVLKSPTIIVLLSISLFRSINICFIYLGAAMLGAQIFTMLYPLVVLTHLSLYNDLLPTRWAWVWVNSGSLWWTERPGVLRFMGSQRVGRDWATELNWTELNDLLCLLVQSLS